MYDRFLRYYQTASPDFQTIYGYDYAPGDEEPGVHNGASWSATRETPIGSAHPARGNTSQMAHRFDCLAVTLEMPFKVTARMLISHSCVALVIGRW